MRQPLLATLLMAGVATLTLSVPAGAMGLGRPTDPAMATQAPAVEQAREAGEKPRREDRRNDRRRADAGPTQDDMLVLVREAGSRGRGRGRD